MSTVAEVSAKITADVSSFTRGMQSASRAADDLKRETDTLRKQSIDVNTNPFIAAVNNANKHLDSFQTEIVKSKDQSLDANTRPFIDAVDSANRHLDALQADAKHPITVHGSVAGLTGQTTAAQAGMAGMAGSAKKTGGAMGVLGKGMMVAGVAAVGVGMLGMALGKTAQKAQESAAVANTTAQIIRNTGGAAKVTSTQVAALATSISEKTGKDDEAIQSGMNLLLTFQKVSNAGTGQAAVFDRASAAAVDLAATGFTSIEGASKMLGKALNDPTKGMTALGRAGVKFTDGEAKKIKAMQKSGDLLGAQQVILDKVEGKVKGVAAASASPIEKISTQFENLQEVIGASLLPVISDLSKTLGPVFAQIGPPLGKVVGILGGAFTQVLTALTPVLGPLTEAFASIAGIVGGALVSVITAMTPTLTLIATIFADLASTIGPILAPVLAVIAKLIGAILTAVAPLLPPLAELIQTIFKAAAPILLIVGDALIQVVNALMPIVAAITPILPMVGQMVTLMGTILTPILEALSPVIVVLAGVLANLLGRSIGLTMAGIGGLIQVFAKVAPFVINNVTIPVVNAFISFASGILGAAETAFSWVPGLGDKLGEAKSALDTFKGTATTAMKGAADKISTEGDRIGESMRLAGKEMLVNGPPEAKTAGKALGINYAAGMVGVLPKSTAAAKQHANAAQAALNKKNLDVHKAGATAGTKIADGMKSAKPTVDAAAKTVAGGLATGVTTEITRQTPAVEAAARAMGARAAAAVKTGAQVSSPSKATIYVGRMIALGLQVGISKERGRVVQEAKMAAADALAAVKAANKAVREAKTPADKAQALRDLTRAQWAYADALAASKNAGKDFDRQFLTAGIEAAAAALDRYKAKARNALDLFTSVRDAMKGFGGITSIALPDGATPGITDILGNMQAKLGAIKAFGSDLQRLRKLGLNNAVLQDIISAGPIQGDQIAQAILNTAKGGAAGVAQVNQAQRELVTAGGVVGDAASQSQYGMTGAQARGVVNTKITVASGGIVINFGDGVRAGDRTAIRGVVDVAVRKALAAAAREAAK